MIIMRNIGRHGNNTIATKKLSKNNNKTKEE